MVSCLRCYCPSFMASLCWARQDIWSLAEELCHLFKHVLPWDCQDRQVIPFIDCWLAVDRRVPGESSQRCFTPLFHEWPPQG